MDGQEEFIVQPNEIILIEKVKNIHAKLFLIKIENILVLSRISLLTVKDKADVHSQIREYIF
jgi:hypothetical protein